MRGEMDVRTCNLDFRIPKNVMSSYWFNYNLESITERRFVNALQIFKNKRNT